MDVDEHGTPDKKGKVTKITASQCGHWKGQISSSLKGVENLGKGGSCAGRVHVGQTC